MLEEDLDSLRQILARAVNASGIQRRDVERALKLRNGTLGKLLDGSLDLRVEHLTALARLLRVPPGDFLRLGCPQAGAAATYCGFQRRRPPVPVKATTARSEATSGGSWLIEVVGLVISLYFSRVYRTSSPQLW